LKAKVHYRVHNNPPLQHEPDKSSPIIFLKIQSNIIMSSTPCTSFLGLKEITDVAWDLLWRHGKSRCE